MHIEEKNLIDKMVFLRGFALSIEIVFFSIFHQNLVDVYYTRMYTLHDSLKFITFFCPVYSQLVQVTDEGN